MYWLQTPQDRNVWSKTIKSNAGKGKGKDTKGKGMGKGKERQPVEGPPFGAIRCPHPNCGAWVSGKGDLSKHIAFMHREGTNAEEGFKCSQCQHISINRCLRSRRERTCHRPGSAECIDCNIWFADKYKMYKHRPAEHGDSKLDSKGRPIP